MTQLRQFLPSPAVQLRTMVIGESGVSLTGRLTSHRWPSPVTSTSDPRLIGVSNRSFGAPASNGGAFRVSTTFHLRPGTDL